MGIFTSKVTKAAVSPQPEVTAAAVGGAYYSSQVAGPNLIGDWWSPTRLARCVTVQCLWRLYRVPVTLWQRCWRTWN
jgi:hypothetical protein